MSEVLVPGATGTNGRRLVRLLADAGHAVRAATRYPAYISDGVEPALGCEPTPLARALARELAVTVVPGADAR